MGSGRPLPLGVLGLLSRMGEGRNAWHCSQRAEYNFWLSQIYWPRPLSFFCGAPFRAREESESAPLAPLIDGRIARGKTVEAVQTDEGVLISRQGMINRLFRLYRYGRTNIIFHQDLEWYTVMCAHVRLD